MSNELHPTIKAWLTRAQHDLDTAKVIAASKQDLLDTAIYHCQQAGEKALKAYLVSQNLDIPKTHDLDNLLSVAAPLSPHLSNLQPLAALLTPLATEFRYPTDDEALMPTQEQFDQALDAAQRLLDFVLASLPPETHPAQSLEHPRP
jgi:HEPN domain-containing protein